MGLLSGGSFLGIALSANALQLAELRGSGSRYRLVHAAVFPIGEQRLLSEPGVLGKELHQFLKAQGFSARQAVAGFPAQWLMFKEKSLPDASAEATAAMLVLQAERDFSMDPPSLSLDFLPGIPVKGTQRVILAAAVRDRIASVQRMMLAAGLQLRGVTSTSLAIAGVSGGANVLYMGENGVECLAHDDQGVRAIRYLAPASAVKGGGASPGVSGELRRAAFLSGAKLVSGELAIWDDLGVDDKIAADLFAGENVHVRRGTTFPAMESAGDAGEHSAGSMALALCAANSKWMGLDFLHSRLEPKPPRKFTSARVWAAVGVLTALAAFGYLLLDWRQNAAELTELRQKRDDMKGSEKSAKEFIARVKLATNWGDNRPNYLECLRAVTLCFPDKERIWASTLSVRDDMKGIMTGGASDSKTVLELLDHLKNNAAFADVKMLQMRESEGKNAEVTYSIAFSYLGGG